ncbi:immunity 53 family protein [Pleionea sediminis]|uniref:immunity 53 family protein n=1 Tax=Pleionea sediminis TaxID=2569479 RepID=UPI0011854167|nr:immunity 53 family protein [Pleionea sediminis]
MNDLEKLQGWYLSQCNNDWEHQYGVKIDILNNPGLKLEIDLKGTSLENASFDEYKSDNESESHWLFCKVEDKKFIGASGPLLLDNMIANFC